MNSLSWLLLTLASILGTVLVAALGLVLLALLLGNVSSQLARHDDHRDY